MYRQPLSVFTCAVVLCAWAVPHPAGAALIVDFEHDDNGLSLGNGQMIDAGEFFTHFTISSPDDGDPGEDQSHLGPTIFDSTPGGPNAGGRDKDLLVGLGNVLILQNTAYSSNDGEFFDVPNDEADYNPLDFGTTVFDFVNPVELLSIDLIDIDGGGCVDLTLTDGNGTTRTYHVPQRWTYDIADAPDQVGFAQLRLDTPVDQSGERSNVWATASEMDGFDPLDVRSLEIRLFGSAAIDNLSFSVIPGPPTLLVMLAGLAIGRRRRRR
jgi:hypothetical protein